jgi:hypothetical protein
MMQPVSTMKGLMDNQFNISSHDRLSIGDLPAEIACKVSSVAHTWSTSDTVGEAMQEAVVQSVCKDVEEMARALTFRQVLRSNSLIQENRKKALAYHALAQKQLEIYTTGATARDIVGDGAHPDSTQVPCNAYTGGRAAIRDIPSPAVSVVVPVRQPLIADVSSGTPTFYFGSCCLFCECD